MNEVIKPGYKHTELGWIPDDWEVKKVLDLSRPVRGGSPRPAGSPKFFNGDFIPWLTVASLTNISENQIVVSQTESYLTEEGSRFSRILENDTVIIANSGATLGVSKLLGIKCCANDGVAALLEIKNTSKRFLIYSINSITKKLRESIATGNGQPNLNTEIIGNLKFAFPNSLSEQTAIATALSDMDSYIKSLEALIAKKRLIKQGAMQDLLTPKADWEVRKLGEVGSFKNGINKGEEDFGFGFPFVNLMDVFGKTVVESSGFGLINSTQIDRKVYNLQEGDVLFIRSSVKPEGVGLTAIIDSEIRDTVYSGFLIRFRDNDFLDKEFKKHCFSVESFRKKVMGSATVSANTNINQNSLSQLEISFPGKSEQKRIGTILNNIDSEINSIGNKLSKALLLKQGMMQELLTGRTRLV